MELPDLRGGRDDSLDQDVERLCPECGGQMAEFDRLEDSGAMYIWYACTREDCTGQWLTKKVLRTGASDNPE
jgi:hypothetical protein